VSAPPSTTLDALPQEPYLIVSETVRIPEVEERERELLDIQPLSSRLRIVNFRRSLQAHRRREEREREPASRVAPETEERR